jgi:hypothetical protein
MTRTVTFLGKKKMVNVHDLEFHGGFLDHPPEAKAAKIDSLDLIKIGKFWSSKNIIKKF